MLARWRARRRYERALIELSSQRGPQGEARHRALLQARDLALLGFPSPHRERAIAHYVVGCSALEHGALDEALASAKLAIAERAACPVEGTDDEPSDCALHALVAAIVTRRAGPDDEAAIEALERWVRVARDTNRLTALGDAANQLGLALGRRGRRAEADRAFVESIEARRVALGERAHPTLEARFNRATFRDEAQPIEEVEQTFRTIVDILEERSDRAARELAAASHHNLAVLLEESARGDEARSHFERALSLREQLVGTEHPTLRPTLVRLAQLHHRAGRTIFALPLYDRALAIASSSEGPSAPMTRAIAAWRSELTEGVGPTALAR
jgi:tetratricopeptide (TPR) repeat protein